MKKNEWRWCRHITMLGWQGPVNWSLLWTFRQAVKVPVTWKYCPICGSKRPRKGGGVRPSRYPPIKKVDGKIVCRGCGGAIPKGRQTWCSNQCFNTHCPQQVMHQVRLRDKHICQICKQDIRELQRAQNEMVIPEVPPLPGESFGERWKRQRKLERDMRGPEIREEYDHIIPFSHGGKTSLENMRTLCSPCHKKTPTYGSKARMLKKQLAQPELITHDPH